MNNMKYIDEVQGDIVTEEEMRKRLYDYIDRNDMVETMQDMSFSEIFKNLSEDFQLKIYEETYDRLIEQKYYFSGYDDEEEDE